jgi:acid phosphatase
MRIKVSSQPIGAAAALALLVSLGGCSAHQPAHVSKEGDPRLNALLWMQHAPEYVALCKGIYRSASDALPELLRDYTKRKASCPELKPPAVVLDLDETVLDNSGYQAQLVLEGQQFAADSWDQWEQEGCERVGLIPGARDFVKTAQGLGIAVIYISNRTAPNQAATVKCLEDLDVLGGLEGTTESNDSWLRSKAGGSSKHGRQREVAERYTVLALVGDQLGDFEVPGESPGAAKNQSDRLAALDGTIEQWCPAPEESRTVPISSLWGRRWFVLPNPAYGQWTAPFADRPAHSVLERSAPLDDARPR